MEYTQHERTIHNVRRIDLMLRVNLPKMSQNIECNCKTISNGFVVNLLHIISIFMQIAISVNEIPMP